MMKLAYLTNTVIPADDAQSKQIVAMARNLHRLLGERFLLVSPRVAEQAFFDAGIPWTRIPTGMRRRSVRYAVMALCSAMAFAARRYDGVFTRDVVLATLAALFGVRTVYELHQQPATRTGRTLLGWFKRLRRIQVVTISEALRARLILDFDFPADRVHALHDGVEWDQFTALRSLDRDQLRRELDLPLDRKVIVHTGTVSPDRGFHLVEEILAVPGDFLFVQVGGKPEHVEMWKARFGASQRIRFVPTQPQAKVFRYQVAADLGLFLLTKRTRTWWCCSPLKLFEYMAAGTPVLGISIGSSSEVLTAENGMLFDPERPGSLGAAFAGYLADPEGARRLAARALEDVRRHYTWSERCRRILELY
jgi:glycosyltransferase involved in cell wall biosynthesis